MVEKQQHYVLHTLLLLLVALMIAMCSSSTSSTDPTSDLAPIGAVPGQQSDNAPQEVDGEQLPGRLLFAQAGDLWVWQETTGRQLTEQGNLAHPTWSPDGTSIAAIQREQSFSNLVLLSADGSELLQLTNHGSNYGLGSFERIYDTLWAFYPTFSPDGTEIAFASQYGPPFGSPASDYNLSLFVTPATVGSTRTQLYAPEAGHIGRIAYAQDGTVVFAYSSLFEEPPALFQYVTETGATERVAGVPEQSYDPVFSADGNWLAFTTRTNNGTDISVIPATGGAPIQITTLGITRAPAFAPDNSALAFLAIAPGSTHFDLWIVDLTIEGGNLSAGEARQLTTEMAIDPDSGLSWGR
ncbi:MAG: hypothetical protein GFH25_541210n4 [Chloroflexi bacterium AL-N10]|nr:hypothetical protein [Chloroflexi bacterium AL-N1]NOK69577.1 hypothetical protein [Chloroflexi bacterium AL-N10]NOK72124.1 hypothetical protein [Chloroflexi bacterium AL-N5]